MEHSQDDLVPLYVAEQNEVVVPNDIFKLKRSSDILGPDGKRQRVFRDAGGAETYVDPELFGNDFGLQGDDDDDDDDSNDRDIRLMQNIRLQESMDRSVHGIRILENAAKPMTKGQKKLNSLLRRNNYTQDDLQQQLENDDEGLVFIPVVTPRTAFVNSVLGPEDDRGDCYGCSRGVGIARVSQNKLGDLRQLIVDLYGCTDIHRLCGLVSEYFRTEIMEPCNKNLRKGELALELWTPRGVYDHITKHMDSPDFVVSGMLRELREHLEILRSNAVYKVRAETVRSGRKLGNQDIYVQQKGHRMMLDTMNTMQKLLASNPEKMMFYNPTFNISKDAPSVLAAKSNIEKTTRLESVFEEKE